MSVYTTQLRWILEQSTGETSPEIVIENGRSIIFNFDYPSLKDKVNFEKCFLRHFYTREIGLETYGLFKLKLCDRLNIIMPKYVEMEKTIGLDFDMLETVNYERKSTDKKDRENSGTGEANSQGSSRNNYTATNTNTSNQKDLFSDTPQSRLSDVEKGTWLTNATIKTGNQTEKQNNSNTNTNEYTTSNNTNEKEFTTIEHSEIIKGKTGSDSYADMIMKYRKTIINLYEEIFSELEILFLQLW